MLKLIPVIRKTLLAFLLFVLIAKVVFSHNLSKVDSLKIVLKDASLGTDSLNAYLSLVEACVPEDKLKYVMPALKMADRLLLKTVDVNEKKSLLKKKSALNASLIFGYADEQTNSYKILLQYYQSLITGYEGIKDTTGIIEGLVKLSGFYMRQDNFSVALDYCERALALAQKSTNQRNMADCLRGFQDLYQITGDFKQALITGQKRLEIYRALNDTLSEADLLISLGLISGTMHDWNIASKYFNKAVSIYESSANKEGLRLTYNNMGLILNRIGDYKNALIYYEKSLAIAESLPDKTFVRAILGNIGIVYRNKGLFEKALEYHYKALEVAEKINVIKGQKDWSWKHLATDYLMLKNYKKAKLYSDKYLNATLNQTGTFFYKRDAELLAAQIDSASGNFKDAYSHYMQSVYWRDKLNSEEVKKAAIKEKLQADFELQKEKDRAKQLKKDLFTQQQLQNQKIIRNSFIVGSILLLLLIFVLINRNKLKRTVEMERMRSRLSRDLHDDIGSSLSSINILSRTAQTNLLNSGDEKTKASLEKINERSQRLLDNMSDIIWNINPGNDTIEEVMSRMREYATTMLEAKNIDYDFNFPKEKIDCRLSMEVKNNIYLIFKEAVNNLCKYSGCTHASLSLTFDEKHIHLKIGDNGKGFIEDELKHRGGLRNMQHRAEEIKGLLKLKSIIGKGTEVELIMPRYC